MHVRRNFDTSSAQASKLQRKCIILSQYAFINLIHTQTIFCLFRCDKYDILPFKYWQQSIDTRVANELTLRDAYAHVSTARVVQSYAECICTKNNTHRLLSRIFNIINSNWLQHARTARVGYYYF